MAREYLRRARVLVVCGGTVNESVKNDIAVAERCGSPPPPWTAS